MATEQEPAGYPGWLSERDRPLAGCLVFARDVLPERVITAYGMAPADARLLAEDQAAEAVPLPVLDDQARTAHPWLRAGQAGSWAFAFTDSGVDLTGYHRGAATRLSAGTEAFLIEWNASPFEAMTCLADEVLVTGFEPGRAWDRAGADPDRFLDEMRLAGLPADGPPGPAGPVRADPVPACLRLLELARGIRLTEEMTRGPLLTVQARTRPAAPGAALSPDTEGNPSS
jgi:hypothetical protein